MGTDTVMFMPKILATNASGTKKKPRLARLMIASACAVARSLSRMLMVYMRTRYVPSTLASSASSLFSATWRDLRLLLRKVEQDETEPTDAVSDVPDSEEASV